MKSWDLSEPVSYQVWDFSMSPAYYQNLDQVWDFSMSRAYYQNLQHAKTIRSISKFEPY